MEQNTLYWHKVEDCVPFEEGTKLIVYQNDDEEELYIGMAAYRRNGWELVVHVATDANDIIVRTYYPNVKYWSDLPKCKFPK